jgi:HEAT repeat protein
MLVGLTADGASAVRVAPSLSHPVPEVRRAAVDALTHLKPPPSVELLEEVLRDPDSGVREAAETARRVFAGDDVDEPR